MAYDLVRRGQSRHLLTVDERGPRLLRAQVTSQSAIRGSSSDPDDWTYVLTLNGPGTSKAVTVGADAVVDIRINTTAEQPWRGRSPLEVALLTGQLHANLEQSFGREGENVVGRVIAMPAAIAQVLADGIRGQLNDPAPGRLSRAVRRSTCWRTCPASCRDSARWESSAIAIAADRPARERPEQPR